MKTAQFICTIKDNKEYIIMGIYDNKNMLNEIYERMFYSDVFESLYISIKPITYQNKKYVMNFENDLTE